MSKSIVFYEGEKDYKYSKIVDSLNIDYVPIKYSHFIKYLLKKIFKPLGKNIFFHVRYIKWRGYFFTIPIYILILTLCKLKKIKITWTCHNIWEHQFQSRLQNLLIRHLIYFASDHVIVMHSDLIHNLPLYKKEKIIVANFGDFREFFESQNDINKHFKEKYEKWLGYNNINYPDIVYISTAKINKLQYLITFLEKRTILNGLIIAPKINITVKTRNIFLYTDDMVKGEIKTILKKGDPVAYISHNNISVPTSIYMYASYGIPILGYNIKPISSIINEYKIGLLFDGKTDLGEKIKIIKENYKYYRENALKFINLNNWEKSILAHKKIWKEN